MIRRRKEQLSLSEMMAFSEEAGSVVDLLEPRLRRIDEVLDDAELVETVFDVLRKRRPQSGKRGRPGTAAEVVLRMLVLKHLKSFSYEQLEWEVRGSLAYRHFCRVGMGKVPDAKTMVRLGQLLDGGVLQKIFDRVVALAVEKKVSKGKRMRVDTTVVEARIHAPTDSRLCEDAIRVTRRSMRKLEEAGVQLPFHRARIRTALSRRMREVAQAKRKGKAAKEALKRPYRGLLKIARRTLKQAKEALAAAQKQVRHRRGRGRRAILKQIKNLERFIPLAEGIVRQTYARVFRGETRSDGKIVSIFEPHVTILRKGKRFRPTEFGKLVKVQESEGGLITDIAVVEGTSDIPLLAPSVDRHLQVFGRPPHLAATDRGFFSSDGIAHAEAAGVKRVVVPKPGYKSAERTKFERQRWFKRGRAWRTGGEGRISRLKNHLGMRRTRYRGPSGIPRTVYWAGISNNLLTLSTH